MKKLLLLATLLIGLFASAQDLETINSLVSSKTVQDIENVSKKIINGYQSKLAFFVTKQSVRDEYEKYQNVYFLPVDQLPKDNAKLTDEQKDMLIKVNFGEFYIGQNKDLQIKGELSYYFREVNGSYLDLIGFWITTFYPNNTKEEILDNYKLKEWRYNKDIKFVLKKEGETWRMFRSY
jgi:hypothetical protein